MIFDFKMLQVYLYSIWNFNKSWKSKTKCGNSMLQKKNCIFLVVVVGGLYEVSGISLKFS